LIVWVVWLLAVLYDLLSIIYAGHWSIILADTQQFEFESFYLSLFFSFSHIQHEHSTFELRTLKKTEYKRIPGGKKAQGTSFEINANLKLHIEHEGCCTCTW